MADKTYRIAITQGEPGGCGPDLCIELLQRLDQGALGAELVYVGDVELLTQRAEILGKPLRTVRLDTAETARPRNRGECTTLEIPLSEPARIGKADPSNQRQVLDCIEAAGRGCLEGYFDAMMTSPVHKAAVCQAGIPFTGQTEFVADLCGSTRPLMTFIADQLRVALVTTHLPLVQVPTALTTDRVLQCLRTWSEGLQQYFGLTEPRILVCGLNPHAGEQGFLGAEEQDIIIPALEQAQADGLKVQGPVGADTAFMPRILESTDALLCMYHDQALPAIKHSYLEQAVNLTLGLPFVRTSPDHGTALELAGSGQIRPESSLHAVQLAADMLNRQTVS